MSAVRPSRRRGFSLLEVMIALVIMAVLAGMAWRGVDALVDRPNVPLLRSRFGLPRLTRLKPLNASSLSSAVSRSVTANLLATERSTWAKPGPL